MTRILIADDSQPVRCGLRTLLGLNADWQVCGEAVDGPDAVEKAHQLAPDLILMDFSMPQMDGVQAAREIAESGTDISILLVTLNLLPQIMEFARKAGLRIDLAPELLCCGLSRSGAAQSSWWHSGEAPRRHRPSERQWAT